VCQNPLPLTPVHADAAGAAYRRLLRPTRRRGRPDTASECLVTVAVMRAAGDVEYTVEENPHMETIQVVLDAKLLRAADLAAKRRKVNRSALIRQALREHLKRLHVLDLEDRDRRGYQAQPQRSEEFGTWEDIAAWPED